ncbi:hypothetical protein JB92DRAFT_2836659 [Gautieria morchelliformis]|nr:hypothetical protein JB92DRAFT_2836659 [Gautieria morchelliformis]
MAGKKKKKAKAELLGDSNTLKTRQRDSVDPPLIVDGKRSRTPSARLRDAGAIPPIRPPASKTKAGSKVPATNDGSTSKPPIAKDPLPSIAPTSTSASKGPSKSGDPATRKTGAADAIVARLVVSTIPEEDQQEGDQGGQEDEGDREPGLGLVSEDDLGHADAFGDSEREEDEEEEVADLSEDFESPSSDDNPDSDVEPLSSPVEPPKKKGKAAAKAKAVASMPDKMKFIIPFRNQDEWASQVAKRGSEAAIEIALMPKFFQFLEEAVRAQTVTTSKPKAKKKELVNPFLTPKPPDQTEHPLHKRGLDDTKTEAYQAQLKQLLAAWFNMLSTCP